MEKLSHKITHENLTFEVNLRDDHSFLIKATDPKTLATFINDDCRLQSFRPQIVIAALERRKNIDLKLSLESNDTQERLKMQVRVSYEFMPELEEVLYLTKIKQESLKY